MVAARIRAALEHLPPERLILAPDCGMKCIPRDLSFAKLKALAKGASIVPANCIGVSVQERRSLRTLRPTGSFVYIRIEAGCAITSVNPKSPPFEQEWRA